MKNYKRIPSYRKLREDSMLDVKKVKEPAWGDNLDPDSKYYIYDRAKTYNNTHRNPLKNFSGSRELAKALKYKKQFADGTVDRKKLAKDLEKEYKDLEKIKKKLGRDFKPEELTEMLLYLNDELRKAGINLRPDLMSKKDFLKAQEELEALLSTDYSDEEDEWEDDDDEWEDDEDFFEARKVSKRSRLKEAAEADYEIYICDGNGAASRGMKADGFEVVSMSFKSDAEAYLYGYLACEAMEEGYFDEADWSLNDLIEQHNENNTPHWKDPREVEVGNYPEIEKCLKDVREAEELLYGQDPGFGAPFVYGVKKNGALIYDLDFEEIEKDRLYIEDEFEEDEW